jgi:hypothetical protein
MKKQKESALSNTRIAIVFFVFLSFIIGISLIFKIVNVIERGQFDGYRRFTLVVTNGKNIKVISLSPNLKNIVVFKLKDNLNPLEAGKLLEVPIDGYVTLNSLNINQKISSLFMNTVFKYNSLKTNLTIIDLLKLTMFARTIPESSISETTIEDLNNLELNGLSRLVSDDLIEKDNKTIKIINGTDVGGLGNRLAKLITNMGGNVIMVVTSDSPRPVSEISYIDEKSYTIEKLQKVLGYKVTKAGNDAVSDVTIVIGEDKINSLIF